MPAVDLSVLVVNYNAGPLLERCLSSLEKHLQEIPHEICVVDNASVDGSPEQVRSQFPRVRLIANDTNRGFAAALNQGLRDTAGRYILWLNPDTELLDNGFQELLRHLDRNPKTGILGPYLADSNGRRQLSCRSFPSYRTALFNRHSLLTRWLPGNRFSRQYLHSDWDAFTIRQVDWVSGACLLHRREVSDQIGGLDEQFFLYCEDVDFCLRAKQKGWSVQYHPGARVLHRIAGSSRQTPYRSIAQRHRSLWRYYTKHFPRHPLKDLLVGAGIWTRCGFLILRETANQVLHPRRAVLR